MIPDELKKAVLALSNGTRLEIIDLLGKADLSYTQLLESTRIRKGSLNNHLNKLMNAGLVNNYSKGTFSRPHKSFYRLSRYGGDFLASLLATIEIPFADSYRNTNDSESRKKLCHSVEYDEKAIVMKAFGTSEPFNIGHKRFIQIYENKNEFKYRQNVAVDLKHS